MRAPGAFRSNIFLALVFIQAEILPFEDFDPEIGKMLRNLEWPQNSHFSTNFAEILHVAIIFNVDFKKNKGFCQIQKILLKVLISPPKTFKWL